MYQIIISGIKCIGCRYCAIVCPTVAIDVRSDVLAYVCAPEKCTGCMQCVEKCPEKAITVTKL